MPGGCVVFCRCVVSCTVSCTVPCITAVLLSVGYRASNACGYPNAADGATPFPTFRRAVGVLLVLSLFGACQPARPHKNRGAYPHQIAEALPLPRPLPLHQNGRRGGTATILSRPPGRVNTVRLFKRNGRNPDKVCYKMCYTEMEKPRKRLVSGAFSGGEGGI